MSSISSIPTNTPGETRKPTASGSIGEVFRVFLKLGLTSFGGPIAHLGYYREELVVRRKWIDEPSYVDLVALCQFLPGPASSQVGFSLGVLRGRGLLGGLAAWLGFTMPSALILLAFALSAAAFTGPVAEGFLHGLKIVAVAVVAQAVWGMTRTLTPDRARAMIALAAIAIVVIVAGSFGQIAAIVLGAVAGLGLCRGEAAALSGHLRFPVSRRRGAVALVVFAALFLIPLVISGSAGQAVALFEAFYRSGALVFGGGHVVLPLLQAQVVAPHWVTNETFLAGASGAWAALHIRRLSRRGDGADAERCRGRGDCARRDLPAGAAARLWDAALLGRTTHRPNRSSRHARRKRCCGRCSRAGALQPHLDEWRPFNTRLRTGGRRFPPIDGLEGSAVGCCHIAGCCRYPVSRDA